MLKAIFEGKERSEANECFAIREMGLRSVNAYKNGFEYQKFKVLENCNKNDTQTAQREKITILEILLIYY